MSSDSDRDLVPVLADEHLGGFDIGPTELTGLVLLVSCPVAGLVVPAQA